MGPWCLTGWPGYQPVETVLRVVVKRFGATLDAVSTRTAVV